MKEDFLITDEREAIRVLLIEDSLGDARLIYELIKETNPAYYEIYHNVKLNSGLEKLSKKQIDIVLLDLNLPDSSGLQTLQKVIEISKNDIPVVVISNYNDEVYRKDAIKMGAQDYIIKGEFDGNLLKYVINSAIERKKLINALNAQTNQMQKQNEILIRNQKRFSKAINSLPNVFIICDIDLRISFINDFALKSNGLERDKVLGEKITNIFPPELLDFHLTKFNEAVRKKQPVSYESSVLYNGKNYTIIFNYIPLINDKNEVYEILASNFDITQHQEYKQTIQESELRFRSTFEQAAVGMCHINLEGKFFRINEKFCSISGFEQNELNDIHFSSIFHYNGIKPDLEKIKNLLNDEISTYTVERQIRKKDLSVIWVNLTVSLIKDNKNQPLYYFAVVEDISDRRRAEKLLWETAQRLSIIFRESPSAIAITRLDNGVFLDANSGFERISGYERNEIIGQDSTILKTFIDQKDRENILQKVSEIGTAKNIEVKFRTKSGNIVTGLISSSVITVESVKCLLSVFIDISELKKAHELLEKYAEELNTSKLQLEKTTQELQQLNSNLKELNRDKDKFFSIISHDLRSPFTALLGYSDYLSKNIDELTTDEIKEFAGDMYRSLTSIFRLIENLLSWSAIQSGRIEFKPVRFDFSSMVDEIMNVYEINAARKNLNLINELPPDVNIFADKNMIEIITRNILSNALKFTPSNGTITISAKKQQEFIDIEVVDTGIGMTKSEIDELFKSNHAQTKNGTSNEKGTGLGLFLCKEFVEKNNGKLLIESQKGKGSSFIIRLPVS